MCRSHPSCDGNQMARSALLEPSGLYTRNLECNVNISKRPQTAVGALWCLCAGSYEVRHGKVVSADTSLDHLGAVLARPDQLRHVTYRKSYSAVLKELSDHRTGGPAC
ncbi:unnamed protein product [Gadus morhua 'NCC']